MANRISQLLGHWSENRYKSLWVLVTTIEADGSSYRKYGAMMLINDMGQYFGWLSDGGESRISCLKPSAAGIINRNLLLNTICTKKKFLLGNWVLVAAGW